MTQKIVVPDGAFATYGTSPVVEVGTDPLVDDLDSTYLYWDTTAVNVGARCDIGLSALSAYEVGDPITLHVRLGITGGGEYPEYVAGEVFIATDAGAANNEIAGFSDGTNSGFGFSVWPADGTIVDKTVPLALEAWPGTTEQDVADALGAGAYLDFNSLDNGGYDTPPTATVYKAWITVGDEEPPSSVTGGWKAGVI